MGTVIPSVIIMDRIVYGGIVRMVRSVCFWSGNVFCLWSYGKFMFVVDFLLIPGDFLLIYILTGMTKWKSLNERRKWGALSELNGSHATMWLFVIYSEFLWISDLFFILVQWKMWEIVASGNICVEAFKLCKEAYEYLKFYKFIPPRT